MSGRASQASKAAPGARGKKPAREKVLEVAAALFRQESIRSVGVETIVKQAGVSKISLYRNFASKDDLIAAYLERRNADYWRHIDEILSAQRDDPRSRLRALIDYVARRVATLGYRGCPFINYCAEFPDVAHPGHRIVEQNKNEMRRRLIEMTKAISPRQHQPLADALFLLLEGAYASSQTLGGTDGPATTLPWAAEALIECHTRS
jgi:AcrR family transcriptional regulator